MGKTNNIEFYQIVLDKSLAGFKCVAAKVCMDLDVPDEYLMGVAVGSSADKSLRKRAISEAWERYLLYSSKPSRMLKRPANYGGLKFVSTDSCVLFSRKQEAKRGFPFTSKRSRRMTYWVEAKKSQGDKQVFIPYHYLYARKKIDLGNFIDGWSTNGAASHKGEALALTNGILELKERDSIMCSWITKRRLFSVKNNEFGSKTLSHKIRILENNGFRVAFFVVIDDLGIATVISVLISKNLPYYSLGSACRGNIETAAEKAILESIMIRNSQIELMKQTKLNKNTGLRRHILAPAIYGKKICSWMFKSPHITLEKICKSHPRKEKDIVKKIQEKFDLYHFSYNKRSFNRPFSVVKCVIPMFQPLDISSEWLHDDYRRVRAFSDRKFTPNRYIHPFG